MNYTPPNERNTMSAAKTYSPKDLAEELGVSPKVLRNHLRTSFARSSEAKNTAWVIDAKVAKECKEHFAKNVASAPDEG